MAKVKQVIRRVMLSISQPRYVIKVRPAATINTGGGGDVSALGELIDVVLTDVEVGQVLKWDGSNWVNETDATGGGGGSTTWGDISGDLADQIDLTEVLDEFDQRIGTKQALLGFTPENGTNKGQPNGYAPLDLFGRSLFEHLPRIPAGYILGRKSPTTGDTELLDPADAATILAVPNGLQAYLGFTPEDVANKGVAGGYAALDGTGRVSAAQLPAFVDDVEEYASFADLPVVGETGKIYTTLDTNNVYRWSGSAYVEIAASPGSSDVVTEGATNLYFTEARVRNTPLTGYAAAGSLTALAATDTVLSALGKIGKYMVELGVVAFTAAGRAMLTAATAAAQTALLDVFTSGAKGLAPASGGGTSNFLRADGTWAAPGSSSVIQSIIVAVGDETTAHTVGTGKVTFRMPYAFTLTDIRASLTTAQASGSILTVDVNENGASILSTPLTIDNTEKTSTTAATPAVISDTALADDAEITIDIDQVGSGSAAGLKVALIGYKT